MDLDLETFLIALYVIVDDLYQRDIHPMMPVRGGPPADMSDSEVLCLGLAAQRRSGVPWKSERGVLRSVQNHLRHLFPLLLAKVPSTVACAACGGRSSRSTTRWPRHS